MGMRDWLRLGSSHQHLRDIEWLRAAQARMDASVPDEAIIFLGDSNTYTLTTAAVAPLAVNYGIGAQRSDQLLVSMDNYASMKRAKAVCIMVGTNDILEGRAAGLEDRYAQIAQKVPQGVPVFFSSVPPLAVPGRPELSHLARAAGLALQAVCDENWGCTFVDLHSALDGVSGVLMPDGIHLEAPGFAVWVGLLREAIGGVSVRRSRPRT